MREGRSDWMEMSTSIRLCPVSIALLRDYYRDFSYDPTLFSPGMPCPVYEFSEQRVADYYEALCRKPDRVNFMILFGERPVGELSLKKIDREKRACTLSIHLQNDSVKNRGIGTEAEKQAVEYAFETLGMETVLADAVLTNRRSRHVLEKVGFCPIGEDETFAYYRLEKKTGKGARKVPLFGTI